MCTKSKITPQKLTQFLVTYYTGGYMYLRLGQAFVNQNTGIDSVVNLANIHKTEDDVEALKKIVERYVGDKV
jgi:hypothetical protein